MRLIPVISLALSLIVPHSSLAQSWVPYASQEDLFTGPFAGRTRSPRYHLDVGVFH